MRDQIEAQIREYLQTFNTQIPNLELGNVLILIAIDMMIAEGHIAESDRAQLTFDIGMSLQRFMDRSGGEDILISQR